MAYNLTLSDGSLLKVLSDNTADVTTTSIALVGRNYSGYGVLLNENFLHLLENFSSGVSPQKPVAGQLWWDKLNNRLNVYVVSQTYTGWRPVSTAQISQYPPLAPEIGTLWWDTANTQLKAYSGATIGWVVIGPNPSLNQGVLTTTVVDYYGATHVVANLMVNNKLTAVYSSDTTAFRLPDASPIGGLSYINPGMNFTSVSQTGMISSPGFKLGVFDSNVQLQSLDSANSINISVSPTIGTTKSAILINGVTGLATVAGNATANFGVTTKIYVDSIVNLANVGMKAYVDAANLRMNANMVSTVATANAQLRDYVDDKISTVSGVSSVNVSGGTTGLTTSGGPIVGTGTITLAGTLQADNGGTGKNTYNTGDILYSGSQNPTSLSALAIGTAGRILQSTGSAPAWALASDITVGKASGLSSTAVNWSLPYQLNGSTSFLPPGAQGEVLTINAQGQLTWNPVASGSGSVQISNDISTTALYPLLWNTTSGSTSSVKTSSTKLSFNASTGTLTATAFAGSGASLTGLAAGQLTGTIPSNVLDNSSLFVGTTSINLARASAVQTLTGVSIDGTAAKATDLAGGAANKIVYQTATNATDFIPVGTQNQFLVAGSGGAPGWQNLTVALGGTGNTIVGPRGAVAYSDGSKYVFSDQGTSGQVLTSQGANPPKWTSLTAGTGTVTSVSASVPSFLQVSVTNSTTTPAINISYNGATPLPPTNGGTGASSLTAAGIVTIADNQTITGSKTFGAAPTFNTALAVTSGGTGLTSLATFVRTTGDQTIADDKTFTGNVSAKSYRETSVAMGTGNAINLNLGNYFTKSISATTTLSVSNIPPSGTVASFILVLTVASSAVVNWWPRVKWANGFAPILNINGIHTLGFFTVDGGANWYGYLLGQSMA